MAHRQRKTPWGLYFFLMMCVTGAVLGIVASMQGGR